MYGSGHMKKDSVFKLFYTSLYSFKSIAKSRFVGMGKSLQYVSLLTFIYFLPSFYQLLTSKNEITTIVPNLQIDEGSVYVLIPIYMIFMYILNFGIIIIKISLLSYIAVFIAQLLKRKLPYRQAWRLTTFSITLPTLIFGLLTLFKWTFAYQLAVDLLLCFLFIFFSIRTMRKIK